MRHRANSMMASNLANSASTSNSEHAWFVDSGASHHMTSHQEWFRDLRTPDRPDYIETRDDTPHPIRHIGNVPFGKENNQTCIKNVLHVPTITTNLVSVVMMTYILAYHESSPRPRGLCAKPLTIVITYRICDYNHST